MAESRIQRCGETFGELSDHLYRPRIASLGRMQELAKHELTFLDMDLREQEVWLEGS